MRRIEQAADNCVQADEITPGKGLREYLEAKVEPESKHICTAFRCQDLSLYRDHGGLFMG